MRIVTYGLGLVDLGRRECTVQQWDLQHVMEAIFRLWEDHAAHGQLMVYYVAPQPRSEVPTVTVIVEVGYGPRDPHTAVVLISEEGEIETRSMMRPFAARVPIHAETRSFLQHVNLDQHIPPKGVRNVQIASRWGGFHLGQRWQARDGDRYTITHSEYPAHVAHATARILHAEEFFADLMHLEESQSFATVQCRLHGVSPRQHPLGTRDVVIHRDRLLSGTWIEEMQQAWPFRSDRTCVAYAQTEDVGTPQYGVHNHVFHFVLGYDMPVHHVPVLIRQTLAGMENGTAHSETWAVNVPTGTGPHDLLEHLRRRVFWVRRYQHQMRIRVYQAGIKHGSQAGQVYEVAYYTHRRTNILAMLLDRAEIEPDDDMEPEHISMMQTVVARPQAATAFEEIVAALKQQVDQDMSQDHCADEANLCCHDQRDSSHDTPHSQVESDATNKMQFEVNGKQSSDQTDQAVLQ